MVCLTLVIGNKHLSQLCYDRYIFANLNLLTHIICKTQKQLTSRMLRRYVWHRADGSGANQRSMQLSGARQWKTIPNSCSRMP